MSICLTPLGTFGPKDPEGDRVMRWLRFNFESIYEEVRENYQGKNWEGWRPHFPDDDDFVDTICLVYKGTLPECTAREKEEADWILSMAPKN